MAGTGRGARLTHDLVWSLIDALAVRHGLSISALARRAGLDPTVLNPSKRIGKNGRPRWPSTESLACLLDATGTSFAEFVALEAAVPRREPAPPAQEPPAGLRRASPARREAPRPGALSVTVPPRGFLPLYRPGDRLVLERTETLAVGERAAVIDEVGRLSVGEVAAFGDTLRLVLPGAEGHTDIERSRLSFVSRVVWASQ